MKSYTHAARIAGVLVFVAAAAVEAGRIVLGSPWHGLVPWFSVTQGVLLVALWGASAVVVGQRRKSAFYVPMFGTLMLLTQGVVTRAAGSELGLLYMAMAPLMVVLERIVFAGVLEWYGPDSAAPQAAPRPAPH